MPDSWHAAALPVGIFFMVPIKTLHLLQAGGWRQVILALIGVGVTIAVVTALEPVLTGLGNWHLLLFLVFDVGAMYLVSGLSGSKAADIAAVAPALFPEMQKRCAKPGFYAMLLLASFAHTIDFSPALSTGPWRLTFVRITPWGGTRGYPKPHTATAAKACLMLRPVC